jgi:ribose 1,5-bisphosphokinase
MLVLVVGPSGAGKDTILNLARQALSGDHRFRFVRRVITRPAEAGGEEHEAVSPSEFARRRFALQWHAHGLDYGIPSDITRDLAGDVVVVANVSRTTIAEAATRFPVTVVQITAAPAILAQRLAARGRETATDISNRLARDVPMPANVPIETVMNDTTPAQAAERFVSLLIRAASPVPRS